jgi:hypothetical protein
MDKAKKRPMSLKSSLDQNPVDGAGPAAGLLGGTFDFVSPSPATVRNSTTTNCTIVEVTKKIPLRSFERKAWVLISITN